MQSEDMIFNQSRFVDDAAYFIYTETGEPTFAKFDALYAKIGKDKNRFKNEVKNIIGLQFTDVITNQINMYPEDVFDFLNKNSKWFNNILGSKYNLSTDDIIDMMDSGEPEEENDASDILFEILANSLIDRKQSPYPGKPSLYEIILDEYAKRIYEFESSFD